MKPFDTFAEIEEYSERHTSGNFSCILQDRIGTPSGFYVYWRMIVYRHRAHVLDLPIS